MTKNETIKILRAEVERLAREVERLMVENGKRTNPWAWSPGPTKGNEMAKRKQIERVAKAIRFMVPIPEHMPRLRRVNGVWAEEYWTDRDVRTVKWLTDFTKPERALIRVIAAVALEAAKK